MIVYDAVLGLCSDNKYVPFRTHIAIKESKIFGSLGSKLKIRWNNSVGEIG